jgi:hypothetical protein
MRGYRKNLKAIVPKVQVTARRPKQKQKQKQRPLRDALVQGAFNTPSPAPEVTE